MKGRLVINADDLGLTGEINAGILWGLEHGCITDTSVLVDEPHAAAAVEGVKRLGIVHAGIHVNLDGVLGWSPGGRERYPRETLVAMLESGELAGACENEARRQIETFLSTGLIPSHIDTHHHVHGFMPIFELMLDLASEYRIPALRFSPCGYRLPTRQDIPFHVDGYTSMHEQMRRRGIHACDRYLEGAHRLDAVGPGDTELVVHPSEGGEPWRSAELDALKTGGAVCRVESRGIRLVSFHDLFADLVDRS